MNYKRATRRYWALSALVHRYLSRDPIALVYLKEAEQAGAQIRWKIDQHYIRTDRREAARAAQWEADHAARVAAWESERLSVSAAGCDR